MFFHVIKIFVHEKFEFFKVSKVNFCVKWYISYKRRSQDLASQLFITTVTQYNLSVILDIPCSWPPVCGCADRDDSGLGQAVSIELTNPDLSFDLTGQVNFPTVISGLQLPTIGTVWENRKKCLIFNWNQRHLVSLS